MSFRIVHLYGWKDGGEDDLALLHYMQRPLDLLRSTYGVTGHTYSILHPHALQVGAAADITVLHLVSGLEVEALILQRRRNHLPTIYQIGDDPAAYRAWARQPRRSISQLQGIYHAASICDAVQFTTLGLQQKFRLLHMRQAVLPMLNAIPSTLPQKPARFTVGWGGSSSYREDLVSIAPVLAAFCKRHPDAQIAVVGNESMLREVFQAVPKGQLQVQPYAPQHVYEAFFQKFHVGLAPRRDTAMNQGRTDMKLVEYATAGAAVIAQQSKTFAALQSFTLPFNTNDELDAHLEHCYADRAFCHQQAEQMLQHLRATRGDTVLVKEHWQWYQSLAPTQLHQSVLPPQDAASDKALQCLTSLSGDIQQQESTLRQLVESMPNYEVCRIHLARLLVSQKRFDEAASHARVLLRSPYWHDEALLLLTANGTIPNDRITRSLYSPLVRAERTSYTRESLPDYFAAIQNVAPMHYFMLGYMRHAAPSQQQRGAAAERLALYDTNR